jgi:hypothetical protein
VLAFSSSIKHLLPNAVSNDPDTASSSKRLKLDALPNSLEASSSFVSNISSSNGYEPQVSEWCLKRPTCYDKSLTTNCEMCMNIVVRDIRSNPMKMTNSDPRPLCPYRYKIKWFYALFEFIILRLPLNLLYFKVILVLAHKSNFSIV